VENNTTTFAYYTGNSWAEAWQNKFFRTKLITGLVAFAGLLLFLPYFFAFIEKREGTVLNDWLLQMIPPMNFSVIIFLLIWSVFILALIRCVQEPGICLIILLSVVALLVLRMISIYFVVLDPPEGLIVLTDPLTSLTYGGKGIFITKDLFFSGHTSNLFMVYLCLQKKGDKVFVLLSVLTVAVLVLVQHVHYSMDVLGAFVITFLLVKGVKKLLSR
jgi:membrane-associated phospholipid phosphatase